MSNETKLNVTKRNTKRAIASNVDAVETTKRTKREKQAAFVSAADVIRSLGYATTANEMKSARALLRSHKIDRNTKAISEFFKLRMKQRAAS